MVAWSSLLSLGRVPHALGAILTSRPLPEATAGLCGRCASGRTRVAVLHSPAGHSWCRQQGSTGSEITPGSLFRAEVLVRLLLLVRGVPINLVWSVGSRAYPVAAKRGPSLGVRKLLSVVFLPGSGDAAVIPFSIATRRGHERLALGGMETPKPLYGRAPLQHVYTCTCPCTRT